ncbi:hypothetical protein QBC47DRAFT_407352 [Echria macrotheca]|uniref:Uncharacterized protein n=1 Tax=Echria macrotheca TaxID=438768 RepID=A0AAJ0B3I2_9PEZI|nr:hypothetical protein QBC47DRAFT_407352 [Echria macrotheca]
MSEKDESIFLMSQSVERYARWFSVNRTPNPNTENGEEAHLWLYDRFTRLCDPNRTGNRETQNIFPTFVSFIGSTAAGKSTILRAILMLGLLDGIDLDNTEAVVNLVDQAREGTISMPVPKSDSIDDASSPTTFGVHLYRDEGVTARPRPVPHRRTNSFGHGLQEPKYPLLLADCEGFDASVARPSGADAVDFVETDDAGVRKLPITAPCYGQNGQTGVDLFYARVLYVISDVVVYVTKDDNIMNSLQRILEWAASAMEKSYNQPARKTLIIVRNKEEKISQEGANMTDQAFKELYLHRHRDVLWRNSAVLRSFVEGHNAIVNPEERIEDNQKLYEVLFHKMHCCYIPDRGAPASLLGLPERANTVYQKLQALRAKIKGAAEEEQGLRATSFSEYNAPAMAHILGEVFDHFRQSEGPLDLYKASGGHNPTPQNMEEHLANLLRMTLDRPDQGIDAIDRHLTEAIALALLLRVTRGPPGTMRYPRDMFDRDMLSCWSTALELYLTKYDRCLHRWQVGRDQAVCTVRGRAQHDMHIGASPTQVQPGRFVGRSWSKPEKDGWIRNIGNRFVSFCHQLFPVHHTHHSQERPPKELLLGLRYEIHKGTREVLSGIRSNKTCLACLQAVPDHVLPCGHALCPTCVQELAKPSRYVECAFDVPSCIICGKHNIHQIQLKPRCAGVRILTLDGGGIRGIVELALLDRIRKAVGLDINIKEMFDLVVGTSTGGIIALGIAMTNESLESMLSFFQKAARDTFGNPNGGFKAAAKLGMLVGSFPSIYKQRDLEQQLQKFFGMTPLFAPATSGTFQSTARVAVTTAKDGPDGGSTQCLVANYNRPQGDWDYFEREDDPVLDMAVWEAGLATSAAPIFLPAFRKAKTNYVDGALYANCPARLALEEKDRIWHHDGASLDVLVSLGTGKQAKPFRAPGILSYSFFRPLIKSFENQINSAVKWDEVESASSPLARKRLYRLNPGIRSETGDYVDLDDHEDMAFLRRAIGDEGTLLQTSELETIQRIAHTLLANLFFFEPDDHTTSPGFLRGSIRCRLPHETPATTTLLGQKAISFHIAWATKEEAADVAMIPSGRWVPLRDESGREKPSDMMHEEVFEDGSRIRKFRLDCDLIMDADTKSYCVLAVLLSDCEQKLPISGFPATLLDLKERLAKMWV